MVSHRAAFLHPAVACIAVAAAATLPYLQAAHGYFLGDDFGLVWAFQRQDPLHFLSLFTQSWDAGVYGDVPDEIRPLVALSYQVDSAVGSGAPLAFHVTNIALHLLNSLLVLGLARVIGRLSWAGAALAGAFFAVMPTHAETVAWISGRADSIPTLFYLGALLGFAAWRRSGSGYAYVAAVVCCFFALFSKQNGITIPLIIGAYDLLIERRLPRPTWRYFVPYLPFVALTISYLGLRYALFGNVVRENVMAPPVFATALVDTIANQVEILVFGYFALEDLPSNLRTVLRDGVAVAIGLAVVPAFWSMRNGSATILPGASVRSRLVFFGPVWWLINVAPLTVTYATARHLYLPAVGLAVVVGILFDVVRQTISRRSAFALPVVAAAALGSCVVGLLGPLGEWVGSAAISEKMARELHAEAAAAPSGSLIVLGAPRTASLSPPPLSPQVLHDISPTPGQPWLWSWATPYVYQPPFTSAELSDRVGYVGPLLIDCCGPQQWFDRSISAIESWAAQPAPAPLVVLTWRADTGALVRASDADTLCLRDRALLLTAAWSPELLDRGIGDLVRDVASGRPCGR